MAACERAAPTGHAEGSVGAGTGTTTFDGAVLLEALAGMSVTTDTITVNALLDTATGGNGGTVTLDAAAGLTLAAAGDIDSDGAVSLTGATGIDTAGDVTTTGDDIN